MLQIVDEQLTPGRAVARSYIKQHGVRDRIVQASLERFLSLYEAVREATGNHDAGIYIASGEARAVLPVKATGGRFQYPSAPGNLLERIDHRAEHLAGYFSFLYQSSVQKISANVPDVVCVDQKMYVLHQPVQEEQLVGLEEEQAKLEKYTRQLFLYDPSTHSNPDIGHFPRTVLLVGPPGTGKSSLIKHMFATAKKLERITPLRCITEVYDASNFSSYFGKSTRILKQKLERASNPAGVGIFCIEDADMVLQSRTDNGVFHGVLELQQHLMNHLSGLTPYFGNTLTVLSTNMPQNIDAALISRVQATYYVNPFSKPETHDAYLRMHMPHLSEKERRPVVQATHALGFTGRDLERLVLQAREANTRAPSDQELISRSYGERYDVVTAAQLLALTSAVAGTVPQ